MNQLNLLMEKLGISKAEAEKVMADDYEIDHNNADPYPLTVEQKKVEKATKQVARKVDAYGKSSKRERKADNEKAEIISTIIDAIGGNVTDLEIVNTEREIVFKWHDRKFKIVLSAPRS